MMDLLVKSSGTMVPPDDKDDGPLVSLGWRLSAGPWDVVGTYRSHDDGRVSAGITDHRGDWREVVYGRGSGQRGVERLAWCGYCGRADGEHAEPHRTIGPRAGLGCTAETRNLLALLGAVPAHDRVDLPAPVSASVRVTDRASDRRAVDWALNGAMVSADARKVRPAPTPRTQASGRWSPPMTPRGRKARGEVPRIPARPASHDAPVTRTGRMSTLAAYRRSRGEAWRHLVAWDAAVRHVGAWPDDRGASPARAEVRAAARDAWLAERGGVPKGDAWHVRARSGDVGRDGGLLLAPRKVKPKQEPKQGKRPARPPVRWAWKVRGRSGMSGVVTVGATLSRAQVVDQVRRSLKRGGMAVPPAKGDLIVTRNA